MTALIEQCISTLLRNVQVPMPHPAAPPASPRPSVAIIGAGIAGLSAAWRLRHEAQVTLFEAAGRAGGHAHTVDLQLNGLTAGVDTGFLVFNHRTYPGLTALLAELEVATVASDMSFSVQSAGLEWSGTDLNSLFAQRRNLLRPRFWGLLADILRFNRITTALALSGAGVAHDAELAEPLQDFLRRHRFGPGFQAGYLLPMIACIWSCPTDQMLRFPVGALIRFCHNHGLLQVSNRPQWLTVQGGSRQYVQSLLQRLPNTTQVRLGTPVQQVEPLPPGSGSAGLWVSSAQGRERFDQVILACHTDQSLALLPSATPAERAVLGAIRYQPNRAVLHTDARLLPTRPRAWAAWNYERAADPAREQAQVCLHYLINRLQPLPWRQPVIVSLNPAREPAPDQVHGEFAYSHPVFDLAAVQAQARLPSVQGQRGLWLCGAWAGHGFHEDGLQSGRAVAEACLAQWQRAAPWRDSA